MGSVVSLPSIYSQRPVVDIRPETYYTIAAPDPDESISYQRASHPVAFRQVEPFREA